MFNTRQFFTKSKGLMCGHLKMVKINKLIVKQFVNLNGAKDGKQNRSPTSNSFTP